MIAAIRRMWILAVAIAMAAGITTVSMADPTSETVITVYTGSDMDQADAAALVERAREQGKIRVIIGLDFTVRDEGTLSQAEEASQVQALRSVQDQVERRSLGLVPADSVDRFETIPFMAAWVTATQLERLLDDPQVVSVQHDVPVPPTLADSVPLIQANKLWQKGYKGNNTVVAILDSGVYRHHKMIVDDLVQGACFSTNSGPDIQSVCKAGVTTEIGLNAGRPCPLSIRGCDHGTHVASIAAGWSLDLRGVGYQAEIISMQVFTRLNTDALCGGAGKSPCITSYTADEVRALERLLTWKKNGKYNVVAANMSLGTSTVYTGACDSLEPALAAIIGKLRGRNVAVVIASGNGNPTTGIGYNGAISSPGCISKAIAVGSSTKADNISTFSNHGPMVKVLAPGSNIRAAKAGTQNGLTFKSGTSMATPHVAGAWSLLRSYKKDATVDEIVTALICTGKRLKRTGYDLTKPRIKLLDAWRYLKNPPIDVLTWNFNKASDEDDWEPLLGTWGVVSGSYKLKKFFGSGNWNASWHPNCNQKLTVTATMTRKDVQTTIYHWNSGLILKAQVDEKTNSVSGYWFAYNHLDDDTNVPGKGRAVIWRMDNYNLSTNSGGSALLCQKLNAPVKVNGENVLKVVSNGPNHRFFLNGTLVCSATDAAYVAGSIGLVVAIPNPVVGTQSFKVDRFVLNPSASGLAAAVAEADSDAAETSVHPADFAPRRIPAGVSPAGAM